MHARGIKKSWGKKAFKSGEYSVSPNRPPELPPGVRPRAAAGAKKLSVWGVLINERPILDGGGGLLRGGWKEGTGGVQQQRSFETIDQGGRMVFLIFLNAH